MKLNNKQVSRSIISPTYILAVDGTQQPTVTVNQAIQARTTVMAGHTMDLEVPIHSLAVSPSFSIQDSASPTTTIITHIATTCHPQQGWFALAELPQSVTTTCSVWLISTAHRVQTSPNALITVLQTCLKIINAAGTPSVYRDTAIPTRACASRSQESATASSNAPAMPAVLQRDTAVSQTPSPAAVKAV